MAGREQSAYLADIVREARRARDFAAGYDWPTFQADVRLQHALLIIGEAFSKLEPAYRRALTGVPIREIVGVRNRVAHEYWAVDALIVWQVVTEDLGALLTAVGALAVKSAAVSGGAARAASLDSDEYRPLPGSGSPPPDEGKGQEGPGPHRGRGR